MYDYAMVPDGGRVEPASAEEGDSPGDIVALIAEFDRRIAYLSFSEIARGALAFLDERLHVTRVSVALLLGERDGFRMFDSTIVVRGVESGKVVPFASASLGHTVERKASTYRADIGQWPIPNSVDAALMAAGLHSSFSTPLLCGGRCLGTLNVADKAVDGIGPSTRQIVELVAPRLAFAIHMGMTHDDLVASEARFRDVFATVGDGIVVADVTNRKIMMVNPSMAAMLDRTPEELLGLTIDAIHPADRLSDVIALFVAAIEGRVDQALDVPMVRSDGTAFLADVAARRTILSGNACVVGVFRDASARKQREQENVQVQKIESIRTLAAGIAHDFNNLLTGLICNISLAKPHLDRSSLPWELLDEAQRAAVRSTALTRQLLTFAKGGSPVREIADIVQIVCDSSSLASSGSNVRCQFNLPSQRVLVMGDEGQLAQVIQNIVRNAVEAMPDGGTASIGVSVARGIQDAENEEVRIEIGDHGPGIAPQLFEHLFTPFFTTKPGGSGLGLAVAHSIVQAHGGRIQVSSSRGGGATFTIFLPIVDGVEEDPAPSPAVTPTGGRVLVMDDQVMILHVAGRALRAAGYQTEEVADGVKAIAAYREAMQRGQRFDAAILDLTVSGGMGGREAAAAILVLDPDARIMVSSGYSEDAVMSDFRKHGFRAVLPKPYSADQLLDAVAGLLQS